MRVTYLHYVYNSPAPLVQLNEFARAFRSLGHELNIHAMDTESGSSVSRNVKKMLKPRLSRYLHEINALRKGLSYYRRELKIVQKEKPDLLLTRYKLYHYSSVLVARRFRLPFVLWVDAPASYEQRKYLQEFVQVPGLAEWIERMVINAADRAVVVSQETKRYLPPRTLVNGHIEVAANGVDPDKFCPSLDGKEIRAKFPAPDAVVLGFVGSFSPWHGMESLKSLMVHALDAYPNTCFLMVGEGPRRKEIENFIQSRGWDAQRIIFTDQVDHIDVPRYIAAMDVCLLPYDQGNEGFYFSPLKLFEYMACAKPVLAARIGQVTDVVRDGVDGFLYSSDQTGETISKLKRLIEDFGLRRRLGEKARKTVLERHTWRRTAETVERIFESVLRERGARR